MSQHSALMQEPESSKTSLNPALVPLSWHTFTLSLTWGTLYHVLAAVKEADCPHLQEFKALPGVKTLQITPENRDELYDSI